MKESRYEEKKQQLMGLMRRRKFPGNKLPTEEQLTEILSTSKGTVREILRELEQMGYVSKKHGLGNFVHPSAFNTKMRFEVILEFHKLIEDGGFEAAIVPVPNRAPADEGMSESLARQLEVTDAGEVRFFKRLYMADDKPAILSRICVPRRIMDGEVDAGHVVGSLYGFIKKYCGQELEQSIFHFIPHRASKDDLALLQVEDDSALFFLEQTFYSFYDEIVCVAENTFNLEVLPLTMLRK